MKKGFYTARGSELLEDCLKTEAPITRRVFISLVREGIYQFYAFDERIGCNRYILNKMEDNYGLPTWIHDYERIKF